MKLLGWPRLWIVTSVVAASSCAAEPVGIYTLYRSSPADSKARIHVASFDAKEGEDYNRENCYIAANAFGGPGGIVVRYWCEQGRAR